MIKKKDFTIYWNKVYEPDYLKFDEYLTSILKKNNINFKRFKGNVLNEIDEIKKVTEHHLRSLHPFGDQLRNIILRNTPKKKKNKKM